jgi:anaerobic magnesium-protoporphyrin IX monomethyl ester cyclase
MKNEEFDIVLVNPPHYDFGRVKHVRKASPPLGLLYMATVLRNKGYRVKLLDGMVEPEWFRPEGIAGLSSKVVGITATTPSIGAALSVAELFKRAHSDSVVVLGGPHPSILPEQVAANEFVDFVIVGEGEIQFESLCKSILNHEPNMPTVAAVTKNRLSTPITPDFIRDLDSIPFPDRNLIPLLKYEMSPVNYKRVPSTPAITSRGCPYRCSYCSNPVHGRRVRRHSPGYAVEEILYVSRTFGIKDISYWDDTFTLDRQWIEEFCRLIIDRGIDITWSCTSRVDRIDEGILQLMKRAGCWCISLGVETGSDRLLEVIRKGITKAQVLKAFDICKRVSMDTRAFFILGIPSETREESAETIEFAKRLNPTFAQFTMAVPYPGSEFFDQAKAEGWIPPDWGNFCTYPEDAPVYITKGRTGKELVDLQGQAFRQFYFRAAYVWRRLASLRSVGDLVKNINLAYHLLRF